MTLARMAFLAVSTLCMQCVGWTQTLGADAGNSSSGQPGTSQASTAPEDSRDRIYYPDDTENVKPLARKLLGNIWLDQREIWTSPFHINRQNAKWWILFGGATAALIASDHATATALPNSKDQIRWGNHLSNIGSTYTLIPVVAGIYGLGVGLDDSKARETGVLAAEALVDSLIVVEVSKRIAARTRPNGHRDKEFWEGGQSFPSGHSIASWTLSSVVAQEYGEKKWVPFVAYGLAGVVSASRFAAQQHYLSDVVAGGAVGWFIGHYVVGTHRDHSAHQHGWMPHPQVIPQIEPGAGTYGLTVAFR